MGHWYVAISECETDPIFKKITVNYEKNAYEKYVNFRELCEALQLDWCLYDVLYNLIVLLSVISLCLMFYCCLPQGKLVSYRARQVCVTNSVLELY